ncbi:MAG: 6-phosphogluconolactonase [Thermoplasmata archaeon]
MERGIAPELHVHPDLGAATSALARHLRTRSLRAVRARGRFSWVLAGGHTPERLYRHLATRYRDRLPWAETEVFFGDERCVGPRHSESNYAMARAALLARVPIPRASIHRLRGELRPPSRAAVEYARLLGAGVVRGASTPLFDVVLLGLGPDGHTASLFPGAPALRERDRSVVPVLRSGRPPYVPRLTMTLPALNSSREAIFLVSGPDKSAAVAATFRALSRRNLRWPASLVRSNGVVRWFLDRDAAAELPAAMR